MRETFKCPRCKLLLARNGGIELQGRTTCLAVFQCEVCVDKWKVGDAEFKLALTFAVGEDGIPLHAETLTPLARTQTAAP